MLKTFHVLCPFCLGTLKNAVCLVLLRNRILYRNLLNDQISTVTTNNNKIPLRTVVTSNGMCFVSPIEHKFLLHDVIVYAGE